MNFNLLKIAAAAAAIVLVAACSPSFKPSPIIVTQQQVVVLDVPESLLVCPRVSDLPNPDTLTNLELATLLVEYESANNICYTNNEALRAYLKRARENLERQNSTK